MNLKHEEQRYTINIVLPWNWTWALTESLVKPASGPTKTRSSCNITFSNVDFPTLGRPTIANCNGSFDSSSSPIWLSWLTLSTLHNIESDLEIRKLSCPLRPKESQKLLYNSNRMHRSSPSKEYGEGGAKVIIYIPNKIILQFKLLKLLFHKKTLVLHRITRTRRLNYIGHQTIAHGLRFSNKRYYYFQL